MANKFDDFSQFTATELRGWVIEWKETKEQYKILASMKDAGEAPELAGTNMRRIIDALNERIISADYYLKQQAKK